MLCANKKCRGALGLPKIGDTPADIPIVSGPHEEEQADPFDDDPYDHPVQPADVEKMAKWLVHQKELLDSITNDFAFLNDEGQEEAAKRIQELTEIPKYRRRIEDELQDKPTDEE